MLGRTMCTGVLVPSAGVASRPLVKPQASRPSALCAQSKRYMILMRHADSMDSGRDHDRCISEKGKEDAKAVARKLCEMGWLPDLLLCSNAKRTKQTVDAMAEAISVIGDVDAYHLGTLYTIAALDGMTKAHIAARVREFARDDLNCRIMCVGHNRGWEEAVSMFSQRTVALATANAALLQVQADTWEEALQDQQVWQLVGIVSPTGFAPAKPDLAFFESS